MGYAVPPLGPGHWALSAFGHTVPATASLSAMADATMLTAPGPDGEPREVRLSSPDKVVWPATDAGDVITKVADAIKSVTNDNRGAELMGIMWVSSIVGAVVDNIPMTASMIPVVNELQGAANPAGDDAYWWALALGACFGGNGLIVSAAANVAAAGLVERSGRSIGFVQFMRVGIPVTLISTALAALYVMTRYVWLA